MYLANSIKEKNTKAYNRWEAYSHLSDVIPSVLLYSF